MRKVVTIGDLGEVITGKTPPKSNKNFYGDYAVFIKPTDISEDHKYTYETEEMYSQLAAEQYKSSLVPKGAVCVPCIGTIGTKMTMTHCACYTNQSINSIVCNENYDNEYVYYLIKNFLPGLKAYNLGTASGREYVSKSNFELIEIEAEQDKNTQHRIATILSRYDSLIENYQKQIKLLEEAAQRLYKEWFIDLHFPGHENTKIIDGVPEGWEKKKVGDIAEFKRGKTITKKDIVEGDVPVVAGGLEPAYYCNKHNTASRVITISGSGANAGFTRLYYENVWASDCSFADTNTTKWLHFVYCFLQSSKSAIDNMQKGAAQPHVYAKDINALDIIVPEAELLSGFEDLVSSYFNNVQSLQSQLRLLTEARDRLLPKLMSGELTLEARAEEE